ncbi:alpha/beta hydrolase [Arenibacter sp. F20364]|uniref:alpha/beta hydrolase family protein n=1 Tax=Arenibacter sp. F20364 TaxID=2926415 RepID=UPI001FF6C428|nr:alpha/beta hydrolase [Arenibacter sp. F20364]MCK0192492.1 alpha/beta hydrolase [Arenibacter sp. F20364]
MKTQKTGNAFRNLNLANLVGKLLILFSFGELIAQTWSGTIQYDKPTIDYQVKLVESENQTNAFFTSIDMNAYEIPCQQTILKNDTLKFYVVSDYYTYEYQFVKQDKKFKGNLKIYSNETEQLLNSFETKLNKTEPSHQDKIEKEDFTFESNGLKLNGTLWKPMVSVQKGLLFATSSQGNDRNGTNAEAYYFASLGYTVFNYDKRGTGKSKGDWQTATIEELCSDDMNAIKFFSKISSLPLSDIGIKGSSQGGIKIPYILSKMPELGFGISISCPDGTLLESDLNYWKNINYNNIGRDNIVQALKVQKAGYDYLARNISYEKLEALKNENSSENWLEYVWIPERDIPKDYKLNFNGLPYFEKITQPVLVIQGLADEVIPLDSYKTIEKEIAKSKSTNYRIVALENTTHSMTYLNAEFPYFQILSSDYLPAVSDWLNEIQNK